MTYNGRKVYGATGGAVMLVILTDEHLLSPQQVCHTCLLADRTGQPRWRGGQLRCGYAIRNLSEKQPEQYECHMGFRLVNIDS